MKYLVLKDLISVTLDGKTHTITKDDVRFEKVQNYIETNNLLDLSNLLNFSALTKKIITIENGSIYYKGQLLSTNFSNIMASYLDNPPILDFLVKIHDQLRQIEVLKDPQYLNEVLLSNAYFPIKENPIIFYSSNTNNDTEQVIRKTNIKCFNFYNTSSFLKDLFLKKTDFQDIITKTFGFNSKPLKKIINDDVFPSMDFRIFNYSLMFKDVFSSNNLVTLLESKKVQKTNNEESSRAFNELLKDLCVSKDGNYIEKKALNLILNNSTVVNPDIGLIYEEVKPKIAIEIGSLSFSNINQVETYLKIELEKLRNQPFELNIKEPFLSLDNVKILDFHIAVPKTSSELIVWGQILKNCVGSYGNRVKDRQTMVLGLMKDNDIYRVFEIHNKRINQIQGIGPIPENLVPELKKYLQDKDIISI